MLPASFGEGLAAIIAYALGLAITLLLVALLGQSFARKLGLLNRPDGWFRRIVGIIMVVVGVAVILGLDKLAQTYVLEQGWYAPIENLERLLIG